MGQVIWESANGIDYSPVNPFSLEGEKGIGHGMTLPRDYSTIVDIKVIIHELCDEVCRRARKANVVGKTVSVGARGAGFDFPTGFHRQETIFDSTNNTKDMYKAAFKLFKQNWDSTPIRQLSVGLSNLSSDNNVQLNLFEDVSRKRNLDYAVDDIRDRFGGTAIVYASSLTSAGQAFHRAETIGGHYK